MKNLILMRHAKSSWNHPNLSDRQRPLNKRGKRDALRMGEFLEKQGIEIDAILCSSAQRTQETLSLFLEEFTFENEAKSLDKFYHADLRDYIDELEKLPTETENAMIIGHNPTISEALDFFCDEYEPFPTAAIAHIAFEIDEWHNLIENPNGKLLGYWYPKGI